MSRQDMNNYLAYRKNWMPRLSLSVLCLPLPFITHHNFYDLLPLTSLWMQMGVICIKIKGLEPRFISYLPVPGVFSPGGVQVCAYRYCDI